MQAYLPKTEFYSSESIKLQENLNNANRNTRLTYSAISKLRNKPKYSLKLYEILLLLSDDISLNPSPCQIQFIDDKKWEPLSTLLSKIDACRDIKNYIRPAMLGITESELDSSITNAEANINGYIVIRNDRNINGGGVACYIRNHLF